MRAFLRRRVWRIRGHFCLVLSLERLSHKVYSHSYSSSSSYRYSSSIFSSSFTCRPWRYSLRDLFGGLCYLHYFQLLASLKCTVFVESHFAGQIVGRTALIFDPICSVKHAKAMNGYQIAFAGGSRDGRGSQLLVRNLCPFRCLVILAARKRFWLSEGRCCLVQYCLVHRITITAIHHHIPCHRIHPQNRYHHLIVCRIPTAAYLLAFVRERIHDFGVGFFVVGGRLL